MKNHKQLNPEEHIQALQTGEFLMPRYLSKQRPTADPNMNPKPATKLTERHMTGTVHGHAPIHSRSVNPRTNSGLARGEKTFSEGRPPWSAYERREKGGRFKNPEGGSDKAN